MIQWNAVTWYSKLCALALFVALPFIGFYFGMQYERTSEMIIKNPPVGGGDEIFCTQEAKLCPDGSYVGRTGPNCEFAACPSEQFKTSGTVMGKVSIGPLCPVEPCNYQGPNPYVSRALIFTPQGGGRPVDVPFNVKLSSDGSFSTELPEGNYEVTLTQCDFLGCRYSMPKQIAVMAHRTHELNIDIDTGIR